MPALISDGPVKLGDVRKFAFNCDCEGCDADCESGKGLNDYQADPDFSVLGGAMDRYGNLIFNHVRIFKKIVIPKGQSYPQVGKFPKESGLGEQLRQRYHNSAR